MLATLGPLATAAILILTLFACAPSGTVVNVTIDGGDRTVVLGDAPMLSATVIVTGTATTSVSWTSSETSVATIDPTGTITSLTTGTTVISATSAVDSTKSDSMLLTIQPPGALRWTRQFGTSSSEIARGVAADASGHVYVTGTTDGALEGSSAGTHDVFIRAFDSNGAVRWTRQFGSSYIDYGEGIAVDANGNVYTTGFTIGDLDGISLGESDGFIRSYDRDGNLRWTRQFGTDRFDYAYGIATDLNGHVYVIGDTDGALDGRNAGGGDVYIRSYDRDGNLRWTRQFGTASSDVAIGIATDTNGHVYATGNTFGAFEGGNAGGVDAFIRSYDSDGNLRWTRQFGTASDDRARGIATDASGYVYLTGDTFGALKGGTAGGTDSFIRSYDSEGILRWTRQFGTAGSDYAHGVTTDANGHVYATGYTDDALEGSSVGGNDAFIRSYDRYGNVRWTRQFGTSSDDRAHGITTDANGHIYTTGYTFGALESPNAGNADAFIRSYGR